MKQLITQDNTIKYTFEDCEKQMADEFCRHASITKARDCVIDKLAKGISLALYEDIKVGKVGDTQPNSLEVDVLATAFSSLVEITLEMDKDQKDSWEKIHDLGLPQGDWQFDRTNRIFTLKA